MAKWRMPTSFEATPLGLCQPHSTVLTAGQETISLAFRKWTQLALDDRLYAPNGVLQIYI